MANAGLSDEAWRRVRACLAKHPGLYVKREAPTWRFVEAVLWMARAGAQWRMLPAEFSPFGKLEHFRRVFSRFDKLARRYLAFVHLAAACILLR
jgi:transposase